MECVQKNGRKCKGGWKVSFMGNLRCRFCLRSVGFKEGAAADVAGVLRSVLIDENKRKYDKTLRITAQ